MKRTGCAILISALLGLAPFPTVAAEMDVKMLDHASDGQRGFEPAIVHIEPGDSVHFVATDKGHSVEAIPGMIPVGAHLFAGKISQDLTVKFDRPGVYGYHCGPHYMMGMVGLVVVGTPLNETDARKIAQPRDAKTRFDRLFAALDAEKKPLKR